MLSILRRNVGWTLKVVLGVISLSFIFYFGYSQLQSPQTGESTAIRVGKESISMARYRFFYNDEYERGREQFKDGEIPPFYIEMMQNRARQRVVQHNLIKQFAHSLGITVTDLELAEQIASEKDFDPVAYKNFLKNFYYRNTFSYEDLIREDLLIAKFQAWARKHQNRSEEVSGETTWEFEVLEIHDPEKKEAGEKIHRAWRAGKNPNPLLKKNELEVRKVGPISVTERNQLFFGKIGLEEYKKIFSLARPKETLEAPIKRGNTLLLVRLLEKKEPEGEKSDPPAYEDFSLIDIWFRDFADQTKVEFFLPEQPL